MVIVRGDLDDLRVRHRDLRVERGEFQTPPVLLWGSSDRVRALG